MDKQGILFGSLFGIAIAFGIVFFIIPTTAQAAPGDGNKMCLPYVKLECGCGREIIDGKCQGSPNKFMCDCREEVNGGMIYGKCMGTFKCEGKGFGSDVASGAMDAGGLNALKSIVDQLMQAMKGGGGGGGGGGVPTDPGAQGCTSYYQVTVPSSDPCAIYNPSGVIDAAGGSGSSGVADSLLDALNGGSQTSVSGQILDATKNTQGTTKTNTGTQTTGGSAAASSSVKSAGPGLSGDVRIGTAGATIIANLRQGLSEVAGFFGGSTGGASQALSAAGRLCGTRPWAGSFVANVIPSAFFDGLCEFRGYQVGMPLPQNAARTGSIIQQQQQNTQRPTGFLQPGASNVSPEVDIWAEPASVRLGTRTYIFWNARGVISCRGTGPSFSQSSLSGGASTVPITSPTTFNIECLTSASTTVQDSVTVQIAI